MKGPIEAQDPSAEVEALVARGETARAAELLDVLAVEWARTGSPGRAIAALKKLVLLAPERKEEAGRRIASLAKERDLQLAQRQVLRAGEQRRGRGVDDSAVTSLPGEFELAEPGFGARAGESPRPPAVPPADDSDELQLGAPGAGRTPPGLASPLFGDFTQEELEAVIHGLDLRAFSPGDLVVGEGDVGGSLFVVTSGTLKVFVRGSAPRSALVRTLREGDFFGEISLLSGQPRTATVIAATSCELLELGRSALDGIAAGHPRVLEVLRRFAEGRLKSDAAANR